MVSEQEIKGLKELDDYLKQFTAKVEAKLLRGGLRAGTNVFLKRAQAFLAPHRKTGKLERSLRIRTRLKRGKVTATLIAGNAEAFYPHMVEFGTAAHLIQAENAAGKNVAASMNRRQKKNAGALSFGGVIAEKVEHPGTAAIPFMRHALDGGTTDAVNAMADYLRKRIPKELAKKGK